MILNNKTDQANIFNEPLEDLNLEVFFKRTEIKYENFSEKFMFSQKDFKKQFAHIYAERLTKMRDRVSKRCLIKWGKDIPILQLSELSDENKVKCIIIGTLFKHQELKPSIVKEVSEENQIMPQPTKTHYVSENDLLILEDKTQRIRLVGDFDVTKLVTGIVTGLLGFENESGKFEVQDMCFAGIEMKPEIPLSFSDDCYLLIVSGLGLNTATNLLAVELLIDWIKGNLGSIADQEQSAKICRVLIAGNSVKKSNSLYKLCIINTEIEEESDITTAAQQLDEILEDLAKTIEVDLMPGEFDPTNHVIPQQPIINCVLPKAFKYESFCSVTNPYECKIGGRRILGTSGQPVDDIKTISNFTDPLEILEKTLEWGHLAPSAPDTLDCYPYYKEDPFIITDQPDIYFVGNQPELKTKMINFNGRPLRLISVPFYSKDQKCVLVNLKTLECSPLEITVPK